VLAKFYLTSNKLSLELGPQASFLVSERNEVDANDTNSFEFGIAGGLSYKITKSIFVSGRYVAGLTEAKKDADVKNSLIQFSVGYMF
jgi:opacity protein-like surface antigen